MYTIKQAAARTGLSVPTIRAWERRYAVVSPSRTAAGYRLYDDDAIARLNAMRSLVEIEGWRPSQAAEHVGTPGLDLASLATQASATQRAVERGTRGDDRVTDGEAARAFVGAAGRLDIDGMERVLDEAFASQRFELAMDAVVFPALRAVGRAWADGDLDVAAEHAASETVRRRLSLFFDAARGPMDQASLLVGMPPAGHHELGAFAFAIACRRAGHGVAYLGADVPLVSWLRLARETAVPAIVLGAVTREDATAVDLVVDAIRTIDRPPVCFTGGPASLDAGPASRAVRLPSTFDDAVAVVAAVIATAEPRTAR
ncbi:MAG: MerR family transcriptional regulator [Terriglobales bacterium]